MEDDHEQVSEVSLPRSGPGRRLLGTLAAASASPSRAASDRTGRPQRPPGTPCSARWILQAPVSLFHPDRGCCAAQAAAEAEDHITLEDYEVHDGMNLELYYQ